MTTRPTLLVAPDGVTPVTSEPDSEREKSIQALLITAFGALLAVKPGRELEDGSHEAMEFRHGVANMILEFIGAEKLTKTYGMVFVPPQEGPVAS